MEGGIGFVLEEEREEKEEKRRRPRGRGMGGNRDGHVEIR